MTPTIPAFLNAHFANIARQENLHQFKVVPSPASNQGAGFMSDLLHINLIGQNDPPITLPLVIKLLPANKARRAEFSSALIFERECIFYGRILPLLQRFQTEKGVNQKFNGLPHVYVAIANTTTNEYVLIMKDLRPQGYVMLPKGQLAQYSHVKSVLEQLGRMTGLAMALRAQRPDEFAEIQRLDDVLFRMLESKVFRGLFDASFVQAIEKLQAPDDIATMRQIQRSWYTDLQETMRGEASGRFATVIHGDCWSNNIMFANEGRDACLLDWQGALYASPVLDLTCFLLSTTDKVFRDLHFDALLRLYYDNVSETINQCGSSAEELFTFEDLQAQLKQFGRYGVIRAPILLQIIISDPSNLVDMDALADGGSGSESTQVAAGGMAQFDERSMVVFRQRVSDVLADAKRWGWI